MQPAAAVVCVQGTQVRCAKRLNRSKYRLSWADSYWPKEPLLERVLISATWRMRWIGGSDVAYRYHYCSNFCSVYLLTNLSTGWAKNLYTKLMAIFCQILTYFQNSFTGRFSVVSLQTTSLQIYQKIFQWKNFFQNRLRFNRNMTTSLMCSFISPPCTYLAQKGPGSNRSRDAVGLQS